VIGGVATGTVAGFGFESYHLALRAVAARLASA
jgi:3-dehydroquinate dehydratase-2